MTKPTKHKSSLQEMDGIENSEITNKSSISKIQKKRKAQLIVDELVNGILNGNITTLSRAITLIPFKLPGAFNLPHSNLPAVHPHYRKISISHV